MEDAGLHPIIVYIKRQQTTIADRVDYHPVYVLCMDAGQMPGTSWLMRWCNKDVVNETD